MRLCKSGEREPYKYFEGSPLSQGEFQFNLWGLSDEEASVCEFWDWATLREDIMKYGVCNSLFTAKMPTASSARMYNSVEMDEPQNANIFSRSVNGGEFIIVNKYLIDDFEKIGIWNSAVKNAIISKQGSIQDIDFSILLDPEDKRYEKKVKRLEFLKEKYKTIWEIKQKDLIDMTADRGVYIDQSQSTNIYFADGDNNKISSSHFYAWKKGLKTLCYYLRTLPISTGDKSLAFDASESLLQYVNEQKINDTPSHFTPKSKSADSDVDCFGCGS
jgi:ribonucleoside-diphosphate reductase alpha chain